MTYKEYVREDREKWVGAKVLYRGEAHTVVDVDYNGALLIDKPGRFTPQTCISRFDRELVVIGKE